ncbi:amidohydrolase family protein [Martelella sp. HB161492]|uniref:amidohydrolase family protein n=1 Tax=Martelella sp. HB161492 TaxID=2720726 RepID=UPI00158FA7AD|nr:amidohydrolase family protein [Martelella sp. HB161492]
MTQTPAFRPPPGACNCHCHVVGPRARYPVDPAHPAVPPDAPAEALAALQKRLGLDRVVIVQSLAHGCDNTVTADAIASFGQNARGIALVTADTDQYEIATLARRGFVGIRAHIAGHIPNAAGPEQLLGLSRLCADAGWHIELHLHGAELEALLPVIARLDCPAVIDHMAYPAPELSGSVLRALDLPRVYCKISGIERVDEDDLTIGARSVIRLIDHAADRLVWGNDWPHINVRRVDDLALVDMLATYPAEARQLILVDTPDRLYFQER